MDLFRLHNIESRPIWKPAHIQLQFKGTIVILNKYDNKYICEDVFYEDYVFLAI